VKISIAMATYNGAKYIQEQLESFLTQTQLPDELVVTDDGSTDDTIPLLEAFAVKAPFTVRIYRNAENLGYARNFERAISKCDGDIIFLSDQDDVWFPDKITLVTSEFEKNPDLLVAINDAIIVDETLIDTGLTKLGQTRALGLRNTAFITGCCTAFSSRILTIMLPIPLKGSFVHDTWLHALANRLDSRLLLEQPLQCYRRHSSNTSAFITSKTTRVGALDLVRSNKNEDSRPWCRRRLEQLEMLRERIASIPNDIVGCTRAKAALVSITAEETATLARLALLSFPRLLRLYPVLKMYCKGQYSFFSGWKSMVKDVFYA